MDENGGKDNFKKAFFKNVLISGGYNYLAQGLTFLSSIVIARLLSPENYGLVGLITVFTGFIAVFSDSGISLAVIKSDFGHTYHKALDNLALLMGIVLFVITALLAIPISIFYKNSTLVLPTIVLATTFIIRSISLVRGALLSKQLAFGYLGKVILVNSIVIIVLTIILAWLGFQHWSIIIPQVVSAIVTVIMYERKLRFGFQLYSFKYIKVAFNYTKTIIGSLIGFNLVNYWARNADNLVVGKVYGVADLGIYSRAYSLLTFPLALITGLMGTVLYPSLKKLKIDGGDVNTEYMYVLRVISIIVFPISCILLLFPDLLVHMLWGDKWAKVGTLLPYFGLLIFSQPLLSSVGNVLVLEGKEKTLMYSGWTGAVINVSAILFGSMFSMVAIAQYYSLAYLALVLPFNIIYIFYYTLKFDRLLLLKFWSPIIILSIAIWFGFYINLPLLKYAAIALLFCAIIIGSFKEIKGVLVKVKSMLKSKR